MSVIKEIIIPENKTNLRGTRENDTKPSNAKTLAAKKENLVFPAYLASLSYSMPICLKPTHDLNPLINKFFSPKLFIVILSKNITYLGFS